MIWGRFCTVSVMEEAYLSPCIPKQERVNELSATWVDVRKAQQYMGLQLKSYCMNRRRAVQC